MQLQAEAKAYQDASMEPQIPPDSHVSKARKSSRPTAAAYIPADDDEAEAESPRQAWGPHQGLVTRRKRSRPSEEHRVKAEKANGDDDITAEMSWKGGQLPAHCSLWLTGLWLNGLSVSWSLCSPALLSVMLVAAGRI